MKTATKKYFSKSEANSPSFIRSLLSNFPRERGTAMLCLRIQSSRILEAMAISETVSMQLDPFVFQRVWAKAVARLFPPGISLSSTNHGRSRPRPRQADLDQNTCSNTCEGNKYPGSRHASPPIDFGAIFASLSARSPTQALLEAGNIYCP